MDAADDFNAFEAAGWEQRSAGYDAFFASLTGRVAPALLDAAGVRPGDRVVDVATGPGYAAAAAAEAGARVVAVDVAPAMVELARRAHPALDVRQGDAEALPLPGASCDAVLCNFGLLHLARPEVGAAEFARVLTAGGRMAATVWDVPARCRLIGVFVDAVAEAGAAAPPGVPAGPPFFRFADEAEFGRLLRSAGFVDVSVATISFGHRIASAAALWDGLLGGTVRTSATIEGQPPDVRRRIRDAFERLAGAYLTADGSLELPVSVRLASGRRPG